MPTAEQYKGMSPTWAASTIVIVQPIGRIRVPGTCFGK